MPSIEAIVRDLLAAREGASKQKKACDELEASLRGHFQGEDAPANVVVDVDDKTFLVYLTHTGTGLDTVVIEPATRVE